MTERNYRNYSEAHYAAAKAFAGDDGTCSMSAALYATQSTLPDSTPIQDDVEMAYPYCIQRLDVEELHPRGRHHYNYAKLKAEPVRQRRHAALIHKDNKLPPSFIWDLSFGGLPRGKAYRKLMKQEMHAYMARTLGVDYAEQ